METANNVINDNNSNIEADDSARGFPKRGYAQIDIVETSKGVRLLHDMNLVFPEGTVTAILGPSGAGRSTLMHALTDALPANVVGVGTVHLPGASAFVPQEDRLHGFFTVESYMHHYARLAGVDKIYTKEQVEVKIDNLIMEMGLMEHRNTIVGDIFLKGLSGGQKRRLSVCLEALTEPCNFFLDEPTSGLDAESAFQVMEFLRAYVHAAAGRRVIVTIHQPNSFLWRKVDRVILLSKGKLVYEGPRKKMESFFATNGHPTPKSWNPADHYVTMVNDEFRNHALNVDEWARRYKLWEATHKLGGQTNADIKVAATFSFTNTPKPPAAENQSLTVSDNGSQKTTSVGAPIPRDRIETMRVGGFTAIRELTYRYFLNLWFNPGILATRVTMYAMLGKCCCDCIY
jgi:ABC-type multidrug transport system ATPase subunit